MYGLIVPAGVSREVAEALEGDHHNPAIEEMQARMDLREHLGSRCTSNPLGHTFLGDKRMQDCYVPSEIETRWARLGEQHGRQ